VVGHASELALRENSPKFSGRLSKVSYLLKQVLITHKWVQQALKSPVAFQSATHPVNIFQWYQAAIKIDKYNRLLKIQSVLGLLLHFLVLLAVYTEVGVPLIANPLIAD
jgi:hypothetical protein